MSGKATGMVWELDIPHPQQYVLLAMADHADHEGGNIYPSIAAIAWKTGYSERQVQRIVKELVTSKILELTKQAAGQYGTNHYRIVWENAPRKSPRKPMGDKMSSLDSVRGDILTFRGDTQMSPDPSLEPSLNTYGGDPLGDEIDASLTTSQILTTKEQKATKRLSETSLPPTYGDLFVAVRSKIYHANQQSPRATQERAGQDAKLLLANYPDANANELDDFVSKWNKEKPGADEPRGEKLIGWFDTYRREWKQIQPADEEVIYHIIEPDDYVSDSEAM
jgi:hypothetical protein